MNIEAIAQISYEANSAVIRAFTSDETPSWSSMCSSLQKQWRDDVKREQHTPRPAFKIMTDLDISKCPPKQLILTELHRSLVRTLSAIDINNFHTTQALFKIVISSINSVDRAAGRFVSDLYDTGPEHFEILTACLNAIHGSDQIIDPTHPLWLPIRHKIEAVEFRDQLQPSEIKVKSYIAQQVSNSFNNIVSQLLNLKEPISVKPIRTDNKRLIEEQWSTHKEDGFNMQHRGIEAYPSKQQKSPEERV